MIKYTILTCIWILFVFAAFVVTNRFYNYLSKTYPAVSKWIHEGGLFFKIIEFFSTGIFYNYWREFTLMHFDKSEEFKKLNAPELIDQYQKLQEDPKFKDTKTWEIKGLILFIILVLLTIVVVKL